MKLTERKIEKLIVENGRRDRLVFDEGQRGLAVRITASGGKTYLAQYTLHGRKRRVPLGSVAAVALAKAREATAAIMGDVAKGGDPAADRKDAASKAEQSRNRMTLGSLIDQWVLLHLSQRRPKYAAEAPRALRRTFAAHLGKPAEQLDKATVVQALDKLTSTKLKDQKTGVRPKGTAIANSTAAYGRAAFSWAQKRGSVQNNPFGTLPTRATSTRRERVLTDEELTSIWRATFVSSAPYGQIVRMLMLTGQRREEVAGMASEEISEDQSTWTIPSTRTKNGSPHIVPLCETVRAEFVEPRCDLVFPGKRATAFSGWSKAKSELDKAALVKNWTLHDLRRTLATGLQRLGVRLEVTEAVLNHVGESRSGIVGVYQRHDWADEKRLAMKQWERHILSLTETQPDNSTVIQLNLTKRHQRS